MGQRGNVGSDRILMLDLDLEQDQRLARMQKGKRRKMQKTERRKRKEKEVVEVNQMTKSSRKQSEKSNARRKREERKVRRQILAKKITMLLTTTRHQIVKRREMALNRPM